MYDSELWTSDSGCFFQQHLVPTFVIQKVSTMSSSFDDSADPGSRNDNTCAHLANCWGDLSFQAAREIHAPSEQTSDGVRNIVLSVNSQVGALCGCFTRSAADCADGLRAFTTLEKETVALGLASALALLLLLADRCDVDLPSAIQRKIELNAKKYPAALVRGSALKYHAYEEHTGFGKGCAQVTREEEGRDHISGHAGKKWTDFTLEDLRVQLQRFAKDRGWEKFHTPRNICLALSGEAGELCELFQFKDDSLCQRGLANWTRDERDMLSQELSDVSIYLCRLSDLCHVDLGKALLDNGLLALSRG